MIQSHGCGEDEHWQESYVSTKMLSRRKQMMELRLVTVEPREKPRSPNFKDSPFHLVFPKPNLEGDEQALRTLEIRWMDHLISRNVVKASICLK